MSAGEWIYKQTEPALWTVGYIDGDGKFQSESDHGSPAEAREHIRILNGGSPADRDTPAMLAALRRDLAEARLNLARIMAHLGLAEASEADIDAALAEELS